MVVLGGRGRFLIDGEHPVPRGVIRLQREQRREQHLVTAYISTSVSKHLYWSRPTCIIFVLVTSYMYCPLGGVVGLKREQRHEQHPWRRYSKRFSLLLATPKKYKKPKVGGAGTCLAATQDTPTADDCED